MTKDYHALQEFNDYCSGLGLAAEDEAELSVLRIFHMIEINGQAVTAETVGKWASDPKVAVAMHTQGVWTQLLKLKILCANDYNSWSRKLTDSWGKYLAWLTIQCNNKLLKRKKA